MPGATPLAEARMISKRLILGLFSSIALLGLAKAQTPLYRSKPLPPPPGDARQVIKPVSATDVLTGENPQPQMMPGPLPAGSIESPWCGGVQAGDCNNSIGGNGPLTYEIIGYTGPSFPILGGVLNNRLTVGWMVGADTRTLFFNQERDAAWVLVLGYSYIFNKGQDEQVKEIDVLTRSFVDDLTVQGGRRRVGDALLGQYVTALHRETLNFGFGRDWWLNGPGSLGNEPASNWRVGTEIGGRWGTGHVNLVPKQFTPPFDYNRRGGVYHGIYLSAYTNYERSFGNVIMYSGLKVQWAYNWMNYVPPQDSDLQDLNILMTFGVRF
jgi:hypothetical protein